MLVLKSLIFSSLIKLETTFKLSVFEKNFSNEPGYYEEGHFGIRIENLIYIKKNKFEELTMAPIEKDLIKKNMLNKKEIVWLNNYHAKVKNNLLKFMDFDDKVNLIKACSPI